MLRRVLLTTAFSLLLASCSSRPDIDAPPPQPLMAELPPPPLSRISVPISLQLDPLRDRILQGIPSPLSQGVVDKTLEMNIKPSAPGGALGFLSGALPAQIKAPVGVQLRHKVVMSGLDLVAQGNRLTAVATVDFAIGASAKIPVAAMGLASCGENTPMARLQFTLPGTLLWGTDGKVNWMRDAWSMQWLRPCQLTALNIDVESVLGLPLIRQKVEEAINNGLAKVPEAIAVRPIAEKAWSQLVLPREIGKGMWLCVRPESLFVSSLSGSGKSLNTIVTVSARPQMILSATAPELEKPVLPVMRILPRSTLTPRFSMDFTTEVSLAHADSMLTAILSAKPYLAQGREVVVTSGKIYASGGKAVLGIALKKPFDGSVFVLGRPVFDTTLRAMTFDSLDYSLSTSSALVKSANWLLHGTFRDALGQMARIDFATQLGDVNKKLAKLDIPAGDGVFLRGGVDRIVPSGVAISGQALRVHVRAEGVLTVDVGK